MSDSDRRLELYRLMFEHSLGLMCIHDLDGVLLEVNPAVAKSLGYRPEEGPGRNLSDFLLPAVRPLFKQYLNRIRTNGFDSGLMRLTAKDGSRRTWMYGNVVCLDDGGPVVLCQALDVTYRIAIEHALRKAHRDLTRARDELAGHVQRRTEALERANAELKAEMERRKNVQEELIQARKLESVALLAGGIAHDFNNFLTIVQNYAQEARVLLPQAGPVDRILGEIDKACSRAARLASQLLTFGKGGAPVRRPVSMAEILEEACQFALAGSNVRCEVQVSGNLSLVDADASQITQVLHNILINARQAMPGGGVVYLSAADAEILAGHPTLRPGSYVRVTVHDTGGGIPHDNLAHVFDPYFTTKGPGRGLGLATAHAIISKHNGRISADSAPGKGTTFVIELPAAGPKPAGETIRSVPPAKARILVMDDEEPIRDVLSRILGRNGYEVECAPDGSGAVAMFKSAFEAGRPFSAVFLDLTVPGGVGGKEAVAQIRQIDSRVKAVVSSGYSDGPVMAEYQQFGFDDVLPKPWTAGKVVEVVQRILSGG